jgi:hypothetical protein
MKAFLKGCSEKIDFETKTVHHFLLFEREDGLKFELPSTQEATGKLVEFLSRDPVGAPKEENLEIRDTGSGVPDLDGATTFGGDIEVEHNLDGMGEETNANPTFEVHDPSGEPQNEEEVPSL